MRELITLAAQVTPETINPVQIHMRRQNITEARVIFNQAAGTLKDFLNRVRLRASNIITGQQVDDVGYPSY